ncbi:MAG: hypothetical protein KatS3mg105_5194 [Gemmatales bacterium]|nr:MAG: hypothetical protein KatS3mg105_5194 [Gemmatales bacterium]
MKGLLFTIGLTAFGAIAGIFYPFYGMLAYITISTIHPPTLWFWSVPFWNYARLVGGCSLLGWAMSGFGNWNLGRSGIPLLCLAGYVGFMVLSAINAPFQDIAWRYVQLQSQNRPWRDRCLHAHRLIAQNPHSGLGNGSGAGVHRF